MSQPTGPLVPDSVQLVVPIVLIGPAEAIDLTNAIVGDPTLERTVDGATTLTLDVLDYNRRLVGAHRAGRSFAVVDGLHFELVSLRRAGDIATLGFEDAVVAALRRRTSPRVFAAGTTSRAGIAKVLGSEAGVTVVVDPAFGDTVGDAVTRNSDEDGTAKAGKAASKDTSWSILSSLAGARDGRCFSDGRQVLLGGDDWLLNRAAPVAIAEFTGAVDYIDFELDVNQATSTAEVDVEADRWSLPPGLPVTITDPGPLQGPWLLTKFTRPLHLSRGTLSLERARPTLMEPPPSASADGGDGAYGEAGEPDFLGEPVNTSIRAAERAAGPLGRFMDFALQQKGKKYLWGASGPNTFDCSGLVQQAAAAAGQRLPKPCSSQLDQCQNGAAKMVSVTTALKTKGALLFRVNYPGSGNHVAISMGDGNTTVEARGAAEGCGVFGNAAARRWTHGAVLTFSSTAVTPPNRYGGM